MLEGKYFFYYNYPNLTKFFHREIAILRKLNHKNVIKLVDVLEDLEKQKLYPLHIRLMLVLEIKMIKQMFKWFVPYKNKPFHFISRKSFTSFM